MAGPTSDFDSVTVYGRYINFKGFPIAGLVRFTPSAVVKDYAQRTLLYPVPIEITLNASGSFSYPLPATNDPDITGTFVYRYEEVWAGGRTFDVLVPIETTSPGLDMTTVGPAVATAAFSEYITRDQLNAAVAGLSGSDVGTDPWLKLHAGGNLEALWVGTITRDTNGAPTGAAVVWPDGRTGIYTGVASTAARALGAVDAYAVTYSSTPARTVRQPTVGRDSNGLIVSRPAMTVT